MFSNKSGFNTILRKIDWVKIENMHSSGGRIGTDKVQITHTSNKKNGKVNQIRLNIGIDLLKKLDWHTKDKIDIFHDPDDVFVFKLVKLNDRSGYKLTANGTSPNNRLSFVWPHPQISISARKPYLAEFEIRDNELFFRVADKAND